MTDHASLDNLPEKIRHRAEALAEYGFELSIAVPYATRTLTTTHDEWTESDIAGMIGVSEDQFDEYADKGMDRVRTAHRLFIAEYGGPNHILAEQPMLYRTGTRFITADVNPAQKAEYADIVEGEEKVTVFTVKAGGPSGEPSGHRTVQRETFEDLDSLAESKYRNNSTSDFEELKQWRDLLIEAGVDSETLEEPGEKLPPGHPDSKDHLQYQMQSLEPSEQRGREAGDRR